MRQTELHLTDEDRSLVDEIRSKGAHQAREVNRAHVLASLDRGVPEAQIMAVLGPALLQKLADTNGSTPEQEAAVVSEALPQLVDKLTPEGQLPAQLDLGGLGSILGGLAQGFLKP